MNDTFGRPGGAGGKHDIERMIKGQARIGDIGGVERTLQVSAEALIPSDVLVPQSVNKGVPFVISHPKSGVAKSIRALADTLLDVDAGARRRRG